jgi:UDP-N-acetylglucosamine 4-epimerase
MKNLSEIPKKRWIVTGCAGFIGSHLTETLLALGHTVIGIDNFATGKVKNLEIVKELVGAESASLFTFHECDIRDRTRITSLVKEAKADVVLHQAALGSVPRSIDDPLTSHEVNVDGFMNMMDAARLAGVPRFVYASSSSVYGDIDDARKVESRIGQLLSPYAATKRVNELYAQVYGRTYGMETVGLRYFNVFGPRQDPNGVYAAVIPRWVAALATSQPSVIFGDGTTSRDFCFVKNVVQANILAGSVPSSSEAINQFVNVACGDTTSLTALWSMLRDEVAKVRGVAPESIPAVRYEPFRKGDIKHSCANIDLATRALGYQHSHTVVQGIAELVRAEVPLYL